MLVEGVPHRVVGLESGAWSDFMAGLPLVSARPPSTCTRRVLGHLGFPDIFVLRVLGALVLGSLLSRLCRNLLLFWGMLDCQVLDSCSRSGSLRVSFCVDFF